MRKLAMILALAMLLSIFAIPAMAADSRLVGAVPGLDFEEGKVLCSLTVTANTLSDRIDATIRVFRAGVPVGSWQRSGNGYLFFTEEVTGYYGYEYTMTVLVYVNGQKFADTSVSGVYQ